MQLARQSRRWCLHDKSCRSRFAVALAAASLWIVALSSPCLAQLDGVLGAAANQTEATKVTDRIYMASGFGNTFLVKTDDGNVIIDTSLPTQAPKHHGHLKKISAAPTRYIIFTHAHEDHTGGAGRWKEDDTKVIAQRGFVEHRKYQDRLAIFFAHRNAAQFGFDSKRLVEMARTHRASVEPTILFDEKYEFEQGGVKFELFHTPGETPEHLTVWLPQYKAAFVGDNFYDSFPNLYTLRGTRPRWALEYVDSINKVLALKPEILLPSHGDPIVGAEKIKAALTKYRDAIKYVHDETVKGMNEGHDVYRIMHDVKLPAELDIGDAYGKVSWSVRGIYEGYVGWFDGDPATMYDESPTEAELELVQMAGGAEPVAARANKLVDEGQPVRGLRLAHLSILADPKCHLAAHARAEALKALLAKSRNSNERGWLTSALRHAEEHLAVEAKVKKPIEPTATPKSE
jgi:alkyl sulfatase BDS1-like metallo-beta-lactamase superfamily hydrolase